MIRLQALAVSNMAQDVGGRQGFGVEPYQLNVSLITAADADKQTNIAGGCEAVLCQTC
jgi:hypothetical protein